MISIHRIAALPLRQFYVLRQKPLRLVSLIYSPLFELVMWYFVTQYFYDVGGQSFSFVKVLLAAAILWGFFGHIQHHICVQFLEDIRSRNLLNLFASPIGVSEYLGGFLVTNFFISGLSLLSVAVIAAVFHLYNIAEVGICLAATLWVLFIFGWSIGIFISAMILRFGRFCEALLFVIPSVLATISAVFYSVETLPRAIQPLCFLVPTTYVFEGMRQVVLIGQADWTKWVTAFFLSIFYLVFSIAFFYAVHRSVLKAGLLTRLMTE